MDVLESLEREIEALALPVDGDVLVRAIGLWGRLHARLAEAVAAFDASGLWEVEGASSMAAWLAFRARMSRPAAGRLAALARKLSRCPETLGMWRDGVLSDGQVEAIAANLDAGTVGLFAGQEAELLPALARLSARDVASAMRRWRDLATADREPPEESPQALHLSRGMGNRWCLDGNLDGETGELLATALRLADTDDDDATPRSPAQRRADAFGDVLRYFLDHQDAYRGGRHRPHINAIVDFDRLAAGTAVGETPDGTVLGQATILRLLCDSALHRVVVKGGSAILDYGRATRTIPAPLFNALVVRDRHCRFPGCDRPVGWADGHHIRHWAHGGDTSLDNLVLLCKRHHQQLHETGWHAKLLPDATFEVTDPKGHITATIAPLARARDPSLLV